MATNELTLIFVLLYVAYHQIAAQFPGAGMGALMVSRNPFAALLGQQQSQKTYRTCIGQTEGGDEMRVTFIGSPPAAGLQLRNWWDTKTVEITASVISRSIAGQFQLVVTEYGRIDGRCDSNSLGNIITKHSSPSQMMMWWRRPSEVYGRVGISLELTPGKTVSIVDNINPELTIDIISGGGMALCPVQQIVGNKCMGMINLCCSITRDFRTADESYSANRGMQGMPGGMGVIGDMSRMNVGMNGGNLRADFPGRK